MIAKQGKLVAALADTMVSVYIKYSHDLVSSKYLQSICIICKYLIKLMIGIMMEQLCCQEGRKFHDRYLSDVLSLNLKHIMRKVFGCPIL